MQNLLMKVCVLLASASVLLLTSCAQRNYGQLDDRQSAYEIEQAQKRYVDYSQRVPDYFDTKGEKAIVVYPQEHVWAAYDRDGNLVRASLATAGASWCDDTNRPCRTPVGTFRIRSLGSAECKSSRYPLPNGGGLMPYCMFFNSNMALHGSPDGAVVEGNISHGCVRMFISEAEWLRYNFATIGTKVIVRPY